MNSQPGKENLIIDSSDFPTKQSKRFHIYTVTQLISLVDKRGGVIFRMRGRDDVVLDKGDMRKMGCLLSKVEQGEEFQLMVIYTDTSSKDNTHTFRTTNIINTFHLLSEHIVRSKSNIKPLLEQHGIKLTPSQEAGEGRNLIK